ncbi:MAG: hypothetical protein ACREEK_29780 [Bradyrhizobium sp.]
MIGFGLDLSGYTTNKTSLAAVVTNGEVAEAILLRNSAFFGARDTSLPLQEVARAEARDLKRCLDIGPVAVDIPIDLQDLLFPERAKVIWELTRRPIDKKLKAMPPLADRIGSPVARFSAIMREGNFADRLGNDLFETYPSENLRRLRLAATDTEGRISRQEARQEFFRTLAMEISRATEDDLDAILCALAAVASQDSLVAEGEFQLDGGTLPTGFRILKRIPFSRVILRHEDFSAWLTERGAA